MGPRNITAAAVGVVLAGLFFIGCYLGGFWIFNDSTNRTAHVYSHSYGAQSADVQQINDDWSAIQGAPHDIASDSPAVAVTDRTERLGTANDLCAQIAKTTGSVQVSSDILTWAKGNCTGSAVSATSDYRK